ncbi:uncharacterized protein LOC115693199 [Syzygium oleosum]|uniref:uncharacterized protein LOC115693199 n=1 Tax=Syzygium oleosum TaxID=219896 RepID=UPI0024BA532E|nr:uncharacterized protein LOC115693199 [Syzygium oleosum]
MRRACAHLRFAICDRGSRAPRSIPARHAPNNPMETRSGDRSLGLTTEASASKGAQREEEEEVEDEKRSAPVPPPPPPPEVPSPGDCCGSGCVRCVWDVYCEELEAYNNGLRRDEASGSDSNPS